MSKIGVKIGGNGLKVGLTKSVTTTPAVDPHTLDRNWPGPSGQTTSFRTGDDADIEATIFASIRSNTDRIIVGKLNFTTLAENNSFGNTNVFTDDGGLQTYANDLIIDNFTGLMWYRIAQGSSPDWNTAIDGALASSQGTHTDWFVPNRTQITTIADQETTNGRPLNYSPFNLDLDHQYWTSTTTDSNTTRAWALLTANVSFYGAVSINTKTNTNVNNKYLLCRKHF